VNLKHLNLAVAVALALSAGAAQATNGYFSTGYSIQSQGSGGASIALAQDSLVASTNPAGIAFVGNRLDAGITLFRPDRSAQIVGNGIGADGNYDANGRKYFAIPEFGVSKVINDDFNVGLAVYGNGGMNTTYTRPIPLFGSTNAGVDLEQLFVAPTLSWKLTPQQSVGVSAIYAYQIFSATGLQNFKSSSASTAPGNITDTGTANSSGWGAHVGWLGQVSDSVNLGIHYQSKISMGNFTQYSGLFAGNGSFDIPARFGFGVALKAVDNLTLALDVERVQYSQVSSVTNPLSNLTVLGNRLGSANGPGFGWQDVTSYKLGAVYKVNNQWTLRAGYDYNTQPIPSNQTFFNILAPGVVQHQASLGATYTINSAWDVSGFYSHAFNHQVAGNGSIPPGYSGGEANIRLSEDSLGVGLAWKF
jgi:long-chain fatty acid transport protein